MCVVRYGDGDYVSYFVCSGVSFLVRYFFNEKFIYTTRFNIKIAFNWVNLWKLQLQKCRKMDKLLFQLKCVEMQE